MFPSISFVIILFFLLIQITKPTSNILKSIVIQIKGDCKILGDKIAQEHGYRYVRQVYFLFSYSTKTNNEFYSFRFLIIFVK